MSIQELIEKSLVDAISNRQESDKINNLKFLKAELQRGKSKVVDDSQAISILVGLLRSQVEMYNNLLSGNSGDDKLIECSDLSWDIIEFLPDEVFDQICMGKYFIKSWVSENIDLKSLKNPMQAIKIIKGAFPYIDGELVKNTLKEMV